ncbi:RNA-binding protein 45 isoform X2 [Anthonomus grandis grandis]|nr:RNA-binding protein 45 isoform X2 [Anthonomus grandis grandis]
MDHRRGHHSTEDPPMSRLFIVGPKDLTEQDFRRAFQQFGNVEEIWMVNDKNTGDYKGITYVKFSKTSEAAIALEQMNGTQINGTKNIKVMIASSRDQGSKRDHVDEERSQRLFIICPKLMKEAELSEYFKQFGDVEYVSIVRDRNTGNSKGVAFVKFYKFSHAAKAYEQCDRKYKPVFAEPKSTRETDMSKRGSLGGGGGHPWGSLHQGMGPLSTGSGGSFDSRIGYNNQMPSGIPGPSGGGGEKFTKLTVIASPDINQDQMWKLFDIVPGLDFCQVRYQGGAMGSSRAVGEVVYTSYQWAAHALEKLHGFEYPPGFRLIVKPIYDMAPNRRGGPFERDGLGRNNKMDDRRGDSADLLNIAESIAQATSIIQKAGLDPAAILNLKALNSGSGYQDTVRCNVDLPDQKPLANIDDECVARCFVVCSVPLPNSVLRDVFCRFGNLIDAYLLANRNCGYARYADKHSCQRAIETLHGNEINGVRLKVIVAEEPRKRPRTDDEDL